MWALIPSSTKGCTTTTTSHIMCIPNQGPTGGVAPQIGHVVWGRPRESSCQALQEFVSHVVLNPKPYKTWRVTWALQPSSLTHP